MEENKIDSPLSVMPKHEPTPIPSKEWSNKPAFGEGINFDIIYRVKGKKNLFMPLVKKATKSGMISLIEVGVDNSITVNKDKCDCLGEYVFYKNDSTKIKMGQVFDNLEKCTLEELGKKNDAELMDIMCPNYDAERFKNYHGELVMGWYFEIKEKIDLHSKKEAEKALLKAQEKK